MQGRAVRERWPMPADVRVKVLKRLAKIVDEDAVHEIGQPGHREVIAASRALLAADKLNLEQEKLDRARPPDAPDELPPRIVVPRTDDRPRPQHPG